MGRFHRHDDGTVHSHDHDHDHSHEHHDHAHHHEHAVGSPSAAPVSANHPEHGDHTGYATGRERVEVLEDIFSENDRRAAANRQAFEEHGIVAINLMSSPGAGKTTLLQKTLAALGKDIRFGVVEGDIETAIDADRLRGLGAQVSLLNTGDGFGGECHLDAPMVARALEGLDLSVVDTVLIENVGNLVCPAEFEVGEHKKVMVASVTEGEDKPLKYPVMFRAVEVVVINKIDLLPHLNFDVEQLRDNIRQVNPEAKIFELSATTGEGMEAWLEWLSAQRRA